MNAKKSTAGTIIVLIILLLAYLLDVIPQAEDVPPPPDSGDVPAGNTGGATDWYTIYFVNPTCPPEEERSGGIEDVIVADIRQAQNSVDVAAFDFDLESMVDALIEVEGRGVPARVVTDEDNADLGSIGRLRRNGISVVEDKRSAFMHNKFVVIDDSIVWTGSMNFTTNDVYCHDNNTVRFDSPELAANYTAEMDEMYDGGSFGPTSPENTRAQFIIQGTLVENYFASETEVAPIIVQAVSQAQEEILFMAFAFTNDAIGETILERADAGVNVQGVFETTGSESEFSYYLLMLEAELPAVQVRQDGNPRIMHHKVIIIDRQTVVFGSFNFTDNANDNNDENVLIVHDAVFAETFAGEFARVWDEAKP